MLSIYVYTDIYQGLKIFANSCIYIYIRKTNRAIAAFADDVILCFEKHSMVLWIHVNEGGSLIDTDHFVYNTRPITSFECNSMLTQECVILSLCPHDIIEIAKYRRGKVPRIL